MMKSAGYEDVTFTRVDEKIMVGTTPEECIAFALAIGPAGEVFREAGEALAEARRPEIEREMRTSLRVWNGTGMVSGRRRPLG